MQSPAAAANRLKNKLSPERSERSCAPNNSEHLLSIPNERKALSSKKQKANQSQSHYIMRAD